MSLFGAQLTRQKSYLAEVASRSLRTSSSSTIFMDHVEVELVDEAEAHLREDAEEAERADGGLELGVASLDAALSSLSRSPGRP